MSKWNKGLVWVNGICIGRYWNIGPTQTMFVPGCWLKKGKNEVMVFDMMGTDNAIYPAPQNPYLIHLQKNNPLPTRSPASNGLSPQSTQNIQEFLKTRSNGRLRNSMLRRALCLHRSAQHF
jgi:beta-galactosidase